MNINDPFFFDIIVPSLGVLAGLAAGFLAGFTEGRTRNSGRALLTIAVFLATVLAILYANHRFHFWW